MKSFKLRKIGNHWYPCIDHELGDPINLTEKVDRYLNILDLSKSGEITVELEELGILFGGINIIYFNEEDIVRYLTTDDNFDIRFVVNEHEFLISSDVYWISILSSDLPASGVSADKVNSLSAKSIFTILVLSLTITETLSSAEIS